MSCGIYCILNKSNHKKYIGQSVNLENRFKRHINDLKANRHKNQHLQSSFNKYGINSFEFVIFEYCDKDMLDLRETQYINHFDTMNPANGYNLESGGNLHKSFSDESRKRMSESKLGEKHHFYGVTGENHPKYGKLHSEESKRKMSLSHNSTGYYRVTKMNTTSCKQGYRWGYTYYENSSKKLISSVNIHELEKKVKSKGLPWKCYID